MDNPLGVPREALLVLAGRWTDGGLWKDVQWLAGSLWSAPESSAERSVAWHHLIMAVGNFKRQSGRRLHPGHLSTLPPRDRERDTSFLIPGTSHRLIRDDEATWWAWPLHGAGVATRTAVLAALWPEQHHILDWRVLAATVALTMTSSADLHVVVPDSQESIHVESRHYSPVRNVLHEVSAMSGVELTSIERALYELSRQVGRSPDRTWSEYRRALNDAAARHADGTGRPSEPPSGDRPAIHLDWHRFPGMVPARAAFRSTACVYVQADHDGRPVRVGMARSGLEARYRGGDAHSLDAAVHDSQNVVFVAAAPVGQCEAIEAMLIWEHRAELPYNNLGKLKAPAATVGLLHEGDPPTGWEGYAATPNETLIAGNGDPGD